MTSDQPTVASNIAAQKDAASYPTGIGQNDMGLDRQTTTNYADGSMVPVVYRTTSRAWALATMQFEESWQAAAHEPQEILRQANDMAWSPKGTVYNSDSVWTTLGMIEATKQRSAVNPLIKSQLTSAWRDLYARVFVCAPN